MSSLLAKVIPIDRTLAQFDNSLCALGVQARSGGREQKCVFRRRAAKVQCRHANRLAEKDCASFGANGEKAMRQVR